MTDSFVFNSRRSALIARGGMVASSQPLASAAGIEILESGGNAIDAAVAIAAALNVTEPTSTGIGGDAFALVYIAGEKRVYALNGSGRSPAALTLERVKAQGYKNKLPPFSADTITVPGACAAWADLVERFGALTLAEVLTPAIHLARNGFPVAPITAYFWQRGAERQLASALNGSEMTIDGRGPNPGEIFCNPGLSKTLQMVAEGGKAAFYQGPIGEAIVDVVRRSGGCMAQADLTAHTSTWEEPISAEYNGLRFWECPPNGQGLAALLALNLLEGFDLAGLPPLSARRLHLEIEALRLAFADGFRYIADPQAANIPLEALLSPEYAAERRKLINQDKAAAEVAHGYPLAASDTVYLCAVDAAGNACSLINSNYMGFGTGIVPAGWGFTLQNRGHNFSLENGHPNCLAPNKRPYHTIIPALITRCADDSLYGPFGVMGGFMQPQGHLQVGLALAQDGLDPQEALNLPRFCLQPESPAKPLLVEEGIPDSVLDDLRFRGHYLEKVSGMERAVFGRGQVIRREANGVLWGGSDPRADGCALALHG
jgi:gamma-glutamyltranspeptidase/glutathione hydrolase